MKGPGRPHNMQTLGPPLASPGGGSAAIAALSIAPGELDSGKVGSPTRAGEDWSVTISHRVAIRWRYAA